LGLYEGESSAGPNWIKPDAEGYTKLKDLLHYYYYYYFIFHVMCQVSQAKTKAAILNNMKAGQLHAVMCCPTTLKKFNQVFTYIKTTLFP
jgi:hypothetical protein